MNRYTPTMVWLLLCVIVVLINIRCTNSPSGAFEHNTTSYFIDGKFHDSIPDSVIRKMYGFIVTEQDGSQHSYRVFKEIGHYERDNLYCTAHKKWEVVSAFWQSEKQTFQYMVRTHRRN